MSYIQAYRRDRRYIRAYFHTPQAVQSLGLRRAKEQLELQGIQLLILGDSAKINHNGSGVIASRDFTDIVLCMRQINKAALSLGTSPAAVAKAAIAHEAGHYYGWLRRANGDSKAFPDDPILNECEAWQLGRKFHAGLFNQPSGDIFEAIASYFLQQYKAAPPASLTPPPAAPAVPSTAQYSARSVALSQEIQEGLEDVRQLLQAMQQPKTAQPKAASLQPQTVTAQAPLYQLSVDELAQRKAARKGVTLLASIPVAERVPRSFLSPSSVVCFT